MAHLPLARILHHIFVEPLKACGILYCKVELIPNESCLSLELNGGYQRGDAGWYIGEGE